MIACLIEWIKNELAIKIVYRHGMKEMDAYLEDHPYG